MADAADTKPEDTQTVKDSREALAQPWGIRVPDADKPEDRQEYDLLRGTLPDVLDPAVPEVDTADRLALASRDTKIKPVLASRVAADAAEAAAKRNEGEDGLPERVSKPRGLKSGDKAGNGPTG